MKNPNEMTAAEIIVELRTINSRMTYYEKQIPMMVGGWELEASLSQQKADMERIPILQAELAKHPKRASLSHLFDPVVESVTRQDFPGFNDNTKIIQCDDLAPDHPGFTYKWQDEQAVWQAETAAVYRYAWASVWIVKMVYIPRADTLLWFLAPMDN